MMGLSGALHWTAWFIKYFTILIVTSTLLTVLMKFSITAAMCPNASIAVLLLFFLFYSTATITFTFAVASPWAKCKSYIVVII